jgi:acyl-coenzyme A synthetase/AMP-(fatty) acid ligase
LISIKDETRRDPHALLEILRTRRVQRLFLPFVALQQLATAASKIEDEFLPHDLQEIISAGETLHITSEVSSFLQRLQKYSPVELWNQYGPTETHVVTSYFLHGSPLQWTPSPPIGKPIYNTHVWVLDAQRELAPIGVFGEIAIGGDALATGYWNQPELTTDKFIETSLGRLYKTGDRGRWNEEGQLEFLGRKDEQVKIRGFRVELGEIESILLQHPKINAVAVSTITDDTTSGSGTTKLAAFVVREATDCPQQKLQVWLRQRLPDYMIPTRWHFVDSLPLTSSGKVNRHELSTTKMNGGENHSSCSANAKLIAEPLYDDFDEGEI